MREFFKYWWRCARAAAKGNSSFANSWQWIFGVPAISGLIGYVAARMGRTAITTGSPILDGFLAALGAFLIAWSVAFVVRLFAEPVRLDKDRISEIGRLKTLAGECRSSSFDVFIEEVSDVDRNGVLQENLFRAGITNLEANTTLTAYAVLEDTSPPLPVSPAARLPFMGRGTSNLETRIAPSETAYVLLLERQRDDYRARFDPYVAFSAASSHSDTFSQAMALIERDERRNGLKPETTYSATLAVHAPEAISKRVHFMVYVAADGVATVTCSGPTDANSSDMNYIFLTPPP